jgi:hypothetical protein
VQTCVFALVLSEAHLGVADGPPQGPGRSALSLFFQKASPVRNNLWYSGQSTFRIVVDELMHLWNDQLDKLVSPQGLWWSSNTKIDYRCWGPSASEGPQKHDLTMFLE